MEWHKEVAVEELQHRDHNIDDEAYSLDEEGNVSPTLIPVEVVASIPPPYLQVQVFCNLLRLTCCVDVLLGLYCSFTDRQKYIIYFTCSPTFQLELRTSSHNLLRDHNIILKVSFGFTLHWHYPSNKKFLYSVRVKLILLKFLQRIPHSLSHTHLFVSNPLLIKPNWVDKQFPLDRYVATVYLLRTWFDINLPLRKQSLDCEVYAAKKLKQFLFLFL